MLKSMEARIYTEEHLELVSVDDETSEIIYRCPETSIQWRTKDPWSWLPGWGPKNLIKLEEE